MAGPWQGLKAAGIPAGLIVNDEWDATDDAEFLCLARNHLRTLIDVAREAHRACALVSEQAEDDGLWFFAESAAEGYLQQELRRLHAAVEAIPFAPLLAEDEA